MRAANLSLVAVISLVLNSTLLADDKKPLEGDLKKIQGTWKFVTHEVDGQPAPAEQVANMEIIFTGDKFRVLADGKMVQEGTQKLDGSKKPGQIESKVTGGEQKGSTLLGIYELDGDTIKVCFDVSGKSRPTSFKAKEGQFSATLKRKKK